MNIENGNNKNVAIFGQGFVGLPLALSFAFRGCNVVGIDVVEELINDINNGVTHHTEKFEEKSISEILKEQLASGNYRGTVDAEAALKLCNNIIVTVGIPIRNDKHDLSDLINCCKLIGKNLKKGDLVVIRSTVIPGTTQDVVLPILENESNMKAGIDFYLAYSSERIAEGKAFDEFAYMPTVVAGINEESAKRAEELLKIVCKADIIKASDIKVVETSKVFENVQRDVNIAMVQELARFCEALNIDTYEVINVANTHKRVNLLTPGPGVGGYCIPNAYYYLEPKADEIGVELDILKLSRKKNEKLPKIMVELIQGELEKLGKNIKNSKIGVMGIAMKDYSNDDRISPPVEIIKLLREESFKVEAYDPVVPTNYDFKVDNIDTLMENKDVIVILAKQREFEELSLEYILDRIKPGTLVFDTRNLFKSIKEKLCNNNIIYKSI